MRNYLLIFMLLSCLKLCGQTYFGFPDSNAVWNVTHLSMSGYTALNPYFIFGDTLINGHFYKKIYQSEDSFPNSGNAVYKAAVRDTNQQWYFVFNDSNVELLMYDFNLAPGDTVVINNNQWSQSELRVNAIDSVFLAGQYRKRMKMSFTYDLSGHSYENWIDGIGSTLGLLDAGLSIVCEGKELSCFHENELLIYTSRPDSNCHYSYYTATGKISSGEGLTLFPNPAKDRLILKFDKICEDCSVQIFDISGRPLSEIYYFNSNVFEWYRNDFPPGFFIIKINTANGYWTEKIRWE